MPKLFITDTYDPINNPYRQARDHHDEILLPVNPDEAILKAVDVVHKLQEERIERTNDQVKEAANSALREADNATDRIRQALGASLAVQAKLVKALQLVTELTELDPMATEQVADALDTPTLDVDALTTFVRECFEQVESDISAATVEHDEGTVTYKVVVY